MTREEIMALQGRELDAAVAEHVMGWVWYGPPGYKYLANPRTDPEDDPDWGRVPPYSTDLAAAWQVVERLTSMGYQCELSFVPGYEPEPWLALFFVPPRRVDYVPSALAATAAEAICRAALLAVCGEDDPDADA